MRVVSLYTVYIFYYEVGDIASGSKYIRFAPDYCSYLAQLSMAIQVNMSK